MSGVEIFIVLLIPVVVPLFLTLYGAYGFLHADRLAARLGAPTKAGEILMKVIHGAASVVGLAFLSLLLFHSIPSIRFE